MNTRNDHRFVNASLIGLGLLVIGGAFAYAGAPTSEPLPAGHTVVTAPTPTPPAPTEPRACISEDEVPESGDCIWRADTMGNGEGRSFVAHEDGSVTYIAE